MNIRELLNQIKPYVLGWIFSEGTWAPTFASLTVVGTPTYTGRYIRVGRLVWVQMTITASTSTASAAGSTYCNNLPFTVAQYSGGTVINANTVLPVGGLAFAVGSKNCWLPAWSATGNILVASGWFEIS